MIEVAYTKSLQAAKILI